jgi:phosphatidylglycerol:prolipoprotein diacylglycerol transferase
MFPVLKIFGLELNNYIFLYIVAIVFSTLLLRHELKRNHYPPHLYIWLIATGVISGMIGSKIYYFLEVWNEVIHSPFKNFFEIGGSGWFGGFIFGGVAVVLTIKMKKLPVLKTLDIIILVVPFAQIFGRMGCFLAGCCHGIPTTVPWGMAFPEGLYPKNVKVHPTQLYEMLVALGIFILLWKLRQRELKHGIKVSLYLILAGIGRFVVEFYRINPKILLGFTVPQCLSVLCIILGTFLIIKANQKDTG